MWGNQYIDTGEHSGDNENDSQYPEWTCQSKILSFLQWPLLSLQSDGVSLLDIK